MNQSDQDWLAFLASSQESVLQWEWLRYWPGTAGFSIGPICLDHHLILYVDRGSFELILDQEPLTLAAGQMLWVAPGTERRMWSPEGVKVVNYRLHFSVSREGQVCRGSRPWLVTRDSRDVLPVFQRLFELQLHPGIYRDSALRGILLDLFARMFERDADEGTGGDQPRRLSPTQRRLIDSYIADHLDQPLNAASLAELVGLSPGYFSRLFKDTYGLAPRTHIKRERVQLAAHHLLESNQLVSEVAWQVGYRNAFLFSRQFREVFQCSPSEYRARHR